MVPDDGPDEADLSLSWMMLVADDPGVLHRCPQKPPEDAPPALQSDRDTVGSDDLVRAVGTARVQLYCSIMCG